MNIDPFPQRIRPDRGVAIKEHLPTLVFVTICTKGRKPWLATDENHQLLRTIWTEATYWKIGPYVILPNHLHFFAWPGRLHADIDDWTQYWKSIFTKRLGRPNCRWQRASFHHRVRSERVLKSGAPICLRIPSERVSFSGRATGHTVARCSKRVFGDRGLGGRATPVTRERGPYRARGNAAPVTRERGPYRLGVMPGRVTRERDPAALRVMPRRSRGSVTLPCSGSCHAGHAGAWTLPRSG
jgi:REP element-mobilizing transposase RayT